MSFTIGTATFTNGSAVVTNVVLTSGTTSYFASGTRMVVGRNPVAAEVEAIAAPTVNTITLRTAWNLPTGSYSFLANQTSEGLRDAVQAIRNNNQSLQAFIDSIDANPNNNTVARRTANGRLKATNATEANDVVALGQLGTAAFSNVTATPSDSTAGRVLKVGDFGVGATNLVNNVDFNNVKYTSSEGTSSGNNSPVPDGTIGVRNTHAYSPDWIAQEFLQISSSPREYIRNFFSGTTWSQWVFRYNNGNILGTVSQSGGIPTGAIIQRGSNVNGSFVMFADGTAMYWGSRNVTGVSINAATYPNNVTCFDCHDPNVLTLTAKTYIVTGASAFDSFGLQVYIVRGQSSGATYLSLGTRPTDQWPFLNSFGSRVITSYSYEFFCIGRWF